MHLFGEKKKVSRLIKSATKLNGQAMQKRLKMQIRNIVVQRIQLMYNVDVINCPRGGGGGGWKDKGGRGGGGGGL